MRICKKCGKQIPTYKDSRTKYCSKECAGNLKRILLRKCARDGCENIISTEKDHRQKYCSHSCAAIKNNEPRKKLRFCLNCEKELNWKQKKFCSRTCNKMYYIKYKIDNGYHVYQSSARLYYIRIRGHKCENCGMSIWITKPIFLSLHHINGDFEDHSPENVKLLCGNCHPLTKTFGIKNIGNGRRINNKRKKKNYKYENQL